MTRLKLPSGLTYGYDSNNQRVCTGTQMGRRDILPEGERDFPIKLRMERLRFVDGDYDKWGAYWGSGNPIFCAWNDCEQVMVFVRAQNRKQAKQLVRKELPQAKFYR